MRDYGISGHKRDSDDDTSATTISELNQINVIAEMKAVSTSSTRGALKDDILKLGGMMDFLKRSGATEFPTCFFVLFDPEHQLPLFGSWSDARGRWPDGVPKLRVLIGPPFKKIELPGAPKC